jgi:hypothetical protein
METPKAKPGKLDAPSKSMLSDIQTIIFDMDGTLYELDGKNNGYRGSTLEKRVLTNANNFVVKRLGCPPNKVGLVIRKGLKDTIGLSHFISKKYKISRPFYFQNVWNIDPNGIVKNYKQSVKIVRKLALNKYRLILLTSAPRVWQKKVMQLLGIQSLFKKIYTKEEFNKKSDIFKHLSKVYEPKTILSVGNQFDTDIKPAKIVGMKSFLVSSPTELKFLSINKPKNHKAKYTSHVKRSIQIGILGPSLNNLPNNLMMKNKMLKAANLVGSLLAEKHIILFTGGADGVMEAASKGSFLAGGITVGTPGRKRASSNSYTKVEICTPIDVGDFLFSGINSCDSLIVFPGGAGTLAEVGLAYRYKIPMIIMIGYNKWYDNLVGKRLDRSKNKLRFFGSKNPKSAVEMAISRINKYT